SGRGGEQIYAVVMAGGKRDRLTVGQYSIGLRCWSKIETNPIVGDFARQHFGGQSFPLRGALVVWGPVEAAIGGSAHSGRDRHFVIERDGVEIHGRHSGARGHKLHGKRSRLIGGERSYKFTIRN